MPETTRIADQLSLTYLGDAAGEGWFGPALRPTLRKISPDAAARRPLPDRHSIGELVLHVAANMELVRARLDGRAIELTREVDWPAFEEPWAAAWSDALASLDARYEALVARIRDTEDDQLDRPVVGRPHSVYVMLHGIIQHNIYHAGQIALLRDARTTG